MCSPPNIRFAAQYSTGKFNKDRNIIIHTPPSFWNRAEKKICYAGTEFILNFRKGKQYHDEKSRKVQVIH